MSSTDQYIDSNNSTPNEMSTMYVNDAATPQLYTTISNASFGQKDETVKFVYGAATTDHYTTISDASFGQKDETVKFVNGAATTDHYTSILDESLDQNDETVKYESLKYDNDAATTDLYTTISDASLVQREETFKHVNRAATNNPNTFIPNASHGQTEKPFKRTPYGRLCCFAVIILFILVLLAFAIFGILNLSEPSKHQDQPSIKSTTQGPTTTTTPPQTSQYIAFNAYNRREEVGSSGIVIGCNMRNAPGWTNMMLTRITTGSTAITSVFSLVKGDSSSKPLFPRASYAITEDDSSVSVTITLSTLNCQDRGVYTCTATGQTSPLTTDMTFEIFRNPGTPTLTLNPDQIQDLMFHRGGFEHQCRAEVGFPPGNLTVIYKMKGQSTFTPFQSDRIIQFPTTTSMTQCGTTKYFKFGLNFTSADEGGEVKCVATNQELGVTEESDVGTLELIPRQLCNTTSVPKFLHHPTSCNKYVDCVAKYPFGLECPDSSHCANIGTVVQCGGCDGVICPWNITTTTQGPTTTTTPPSISQFINCTDKTAFIGKSVTLTCNMTVAFDYINVTKATRNLADVISAGNVIDRNLKTGEHVVFGQSSVQITYESVECDDGGLFTLFVQKTGGNTESQAVTLNIWAKPKSVSMTLHADFVINTDRLDSEHICDGFVGYPGGHMEVTMTKQGDPNVYSVPLADYDGSRGNTMTTENCNNKARLEFGLKLGTEWQNGTITCRAKNSKVFEDGDAEQNDTAILYLIPADFCKGADDNTFKANPFSCNKFVQCSDEHSYGRGCGGQCYTGLSVAPLCGDCQTYPCTIIPLTTTTTTQATTTPPPDVSTTNEPTTTTKSPPTLQYIAFNAYNRREEVGSSGIVIGCNMRNAPGWTNMIVTRITTGSTAITSVFSLVKGDSSSKPLFPRASYAITEDDSSVSVTITLSTLNCQDRGVYTCTATGQTSPLTTNMTFEIFRNPGTPTLTLNPDQIQDLMFHRGGLEHQCRAEVGFPPGNLTVVYKMKGQSTFTPFQGDRIIQYPTTTSMTQCGTTKYFKFGLNFTSADEGGKVKCVATNKELGVTEESDVGTLELIPRQLCNTTSAPTFSHHPTNCNKYVDCVAKYPFGSQCPNPNQCANIGTNVQCGGCDGVICPWNITTTTQGPTTTTTPPPTSQFINCTDKTAFIGKSVTLTCNMTVAFDYINVTKATRNLADVISVGNVINRNLKTGEHVVFGQSSVQITYESVECDDGGLFTLFVQKTGGRTESQAVKLNIWDKPKSVSMTLHADFVINTDRAGSEHMCDGLVGYPGGQLEVTMTKQGDPNVYSVPLADYDGSRGNTMTTENCNNKARLEFGLKLGTEWQNGTITCRAKNSKVLEDGDAEQNDTAVLYLIPADFCKGADDNTFKANPFSCNKFVQCSDEHSYGRGCGEECYTGLSVAPLCGDCQTYPCTIIPSTTTASTKATTTLPPDVLATCSGANSLIGSSATVTCSVNKNTYSYINVTFTLSKTQTSNHVFSIDPTNGVVNDNSGANRAVTVSNAGKDITITFTSLACSDEGDFHFNVFAVSGDSSTTASVGVRDTPKLNPTLTPATRVAAGYQLYPNINCSGETGYPSGMINLQIKLDGSSSFVNFTEFEKRESSKDDKCAITKYVLFSGIATMALNWSYIRCATDHPDAVNTLYSSEERLLVIDGTLCYGKPEGAMLYHPYSCGQWVTCSNNVIFVSNCGSATPCIKINETSATGHCSSTCAHCPSYHIIIPGS